MQRVHNKTAGMRDTLERLYERYNHRELVPPDPLQFVYRYSKKRDMEVAGFIASALAYGRVQQIEKSVGNLLGRMKGEPYGFVVDFGRAERRLLSDFKHRFTSGDDIADLLVLMKWVLREHGSIEKYFCECGGNEGENVLPGLACFCDSLSEMYSKKHNGQMSTGLMYLLSSPTRGSACKRLNLFLRWMVRDDDVDAGVWKSVDKARLVVPIDVHMGRLCRILGFYDDKTISLRAAVKITDGFKKIAPADPVKYDFCLSRIGIIEDCDGRYGERCKSCELYGYCLRRENWQNGIKGS